MKTSTRLLQPDLFSAKPIDISVKKGVPAYNGYFFFVSFDFSAGALTYNNYEAKFSWKLHENEEN